MAIACYATVCTKAYTICVVNFTMKPYEHFEEALKDAYANGWLAAMCKFGVDIDICERARCRCLHLREETR